jgi:hypothetical protein
MSQLAPVDEVTAVENRQTWKILKRGVHQVIVLAHPADGGVRIKAWQNRVTKCSGHGLLLSVEKYSMVGPGQPQKHPMGFSPMFVIFDCPKKTLIF